jgi:Flp pilus assembly protein TadD
MSSFIEALGVPAEIKLAQEHAASGNVRRAERVLRALIERSPYDSRGLTALAGLLNRCQRPAEAAEFFRKAIEIDPFDPEYQWRLAVTLCQLDRKDEAQEALQQAEAQAEDPKMKRKISSLKSTLQ